MKKIIWITPDFFVDVDIFILEELMKIYDIEWYIISNQKIERKLLDNSNINNYNVVNLKYKQRDLRIIGKYIKIIKIWKKQKPSLIYNTFNGLPYFFPMLFLFFNRNIILYGAHNFTTPKGALNEKFVSLYHACVYKNLKHIQVFSKSQLTHLNRKFNKKNNLYAPLLLKDYGASDVIAPNDKIVFLFFGYIRDYKRLDLLIECFNLLSEKGYENIELQIKGYCDNFDVYEKLYNSKTLITADIRFINDDEVADIFSSCHYCVLPYQDSAQSGIIPLANRYLKPIICSDLDSFVEYVIDGKTGFIFKKDSLSSLTKKMEKVIAEHQMNYTSYVENIKTNNLINFNKEKIIDMYINNINSIIGFTN